MQLTRRRLAVSLAASAAALARPQTAVPTGPDAELNAARDRIRADGEALARQEVRQSAEPAFQFKA
ncbi:MAG: hypothetical protein ABSC23_08890 [Bryobacteraceae bacterium]|jgi:hypothetical protein